MLTNPVSKPKLKGQELVAKSKNLALIFFQLGLNPGSDPHRLERWPK